MKSLLVVLILVAVGCAGGEETPVPQAQPATVTVTETQTQTVTASPTASSGVDDIFDEEESSVNSGDERACELVRLAATREANSPSWIDIMSSAEYKANDFDLQDSIHKAYWTSGDALAADRTLAIVDYCEELGF